MTTITTVLTTVRYRDEHLAALKQAFAPAEIIHVGGDDTEGVAKALERADVAVLAGDLDERHLNAPNLKWVHCDHAGLNKSAKPAVFERGLVVTGSVGRAAQALAQHVFYFALGLTYGAPRLEVAKAEHKWTSVEFRERRGLIGKTMGIIGFGSTGVETARLAKTCGMHVLAYRKSATAAQDNVDVLYAAERGETIEPILRESDYVVLCIRLSNATHHMIGERQLRLMKPTAFLINIARGSVVDEPALVSALKANTIAGAGLDVFEEEPLPPDAAIWDAPNTMITPHATAEVPDLQANSLKIIVENIARYREDRPLLNQLMPDDLYTK